MERGYIKLWRKTLDSGLITNPDVFAFFVWALFKATHKSYKHLVGAQMVELQPGQFVTGIHAAAKELKSTPRKIRTALVTLEKLQILTRRTTNKFSVITIINWDIYQIVKGENDKQNDKPATSQRQASDNKQELEELKEVKPSPKATPPEAIELAKRLGRFIYKRNPKTKTLQNGVAGKTFERWGLDIDRAIRLDGRTINEMESMIDWCQQDDFWHKQILSGEKLRIKFDAMFLKMKDSQPKGGGINGCCPL